MKDKTLIGKKFGEWEILAFSHSTEWTKYWKAKCSCGTERVLAQANLLRGGSKQQGGAEEILESKMRLRD